MKFVYTMQFFEIQGLKLQSIYCNFICIKSLDVKPVCNVGFVFEYSILWLHMKCYKFLFLTSKVIIFQRKVDNNRNYFKHLTQCPFWENRTSHSLLKSSKWDAIYGGVGFQVP